MDRDGLFGDVFGASPSFTFPSAFTGFVGVLVTDNDGRVAVDYALVTVGEANGPPVLTSTFPADASFSVPVGTNQAFSVTASDPDGDTPSARWLLDFVEVANGPLNHSIPLNSIGQHTVRVEVTDGQASGGSVMHQWTVTVLAIDADGDGWNSNTDCNDANAAIHPLARNHRQRHRRRLPRRHARWRHAADGGLYVARGRGDRRHAGHVHEHVVRSGFSAAVYAWTFGDGGSSSDVNPTHTFANAGTFTVTLTVTDPQLFTSTVSHQVTVRICRWRASPSRRTRAFAPCRWRS